jgi:hypothetical protein
MRNRKSIWLVFTLGVLYILWRIAIFFESIALVVTAVPVAIGLGYLIMTHVENKGERFY